MILNEVVLRRILNKLKFKKMSFRAINGKIALKGLLGKQILPGAPRVAPGFKKTLV
jgi:hypothetical protein